MLQRKNLLSLNVCSERVDKLYKINKGEKKLGKGSFGMVVRAEDRLTGQARAIKIVKKSKLEEAGLDTELLSNEFNLMLGLDHPNVIRLFEVFEDAKYFYFVMELMEGQDLFEAFFVGAGEASEKRVRELFYQIMKGIQYLHRNGIAHRDIKPQNITFADKGLERLKIIDFGVSKYFLRSGNPKEEITLRTQTGSLHYASPEILEGKYDYKCDVWSAGVLLYLMICGVPPFFDPNPAIVVQKVRRCEYGFTEEVWGRVSPEVRDLVQHMIAPECGRFSADEVLAHAWMQLPMEERRFETQLGCFRDVRRCSQLGKLFKELLAAGSSETDAHNAGELFADLDEDGDGLIGREELIAGVRRRMRGSDEEVCAGIRRAFPDAEQISYNSFMAAVNSLAGLSNYELRLEKVFASVEGAESGHITAEDLARFTAAPAAPEPALVEKYRQWIAEVDEEGAGRLSLADVKKALRTWL